MMTVVPADDRDDTARRALTARPRTEVTDPAGTTRPGRGRAPRADRTDGEVGGWAGRVMSLLRVATQVVGVNALVLLGTLAGGVVLGLFPALGAGGSLLARLVAGAPSEHPWREFWAQWRSGWRRHNVLGAPAWPVGALLYVDLAVSRFAQGPLAAVLTAAVLALGAWFAVAVVTLVAVARRYDEPAGRTWRFVALFPLLSPGVSLAVLVVLAAVAVSVLALPVLGPLVGVALPLLVTGWLVDHRLDTLDARTS
ncbi:DUF624 domain-containing protein [Cellulomonas fimi]|uniref:YesL family protein n=2 Tax=Cellulomonas fimi TaxID=1708 RepID=UPI00031A09EB|nr:YesL family protein [Cellulomonas fimi]NNH07989.1 DUF624 domain-containing protein [Cellulomonas fimi]VEH28044.1 Predicted integral membrane protein [Cellulomonas fimi]